MKILILFCLSLLSTFSYGCICQGDRDAAAAFNRAKVVFIGQMISGSERVSKDSIVEIQRHNRINDPGFWKLVYEGEAGDVSFTVKKVFKGNLKKGEEVVVKIHSDTDIGIGCGFSHLLRGGQYLVYAYGDDEDSLTSGACTRTSSVGNPVVQNEDLKFLEHLPPKGSGGHIRGNIVAITKSGEAIPFSHQIKIHIVDVNNRVSIIESDKNGHFQVNKIKPGTYTVIPKLPKGYTLNLDVGLPELQKVVVDDLGTADAHFSVYSDGKVSGRISYKKGQSLFSWRTGIRLTAQDENMTPSGSSLVTTNGYFEIRGIPPGLYILSFDTVIVGNAVVQQYYYPGTFDAKKATPIKVHFGEKIEDINITLPDSFKAGTDGDYEGWIVYDPASKIK